MSTIFMFTLMSLLCIFNSGCSFASRSHLPEGILMKQKKERNLVKIKKLLIEDIQQFCVQKELVHALLNNGTGESLNALKTIVSHPVSVQGELVLYSAVILAIFNDSSGLPILRDHKKYFLTNSEIESLHVAAARVLLNDDSEEMTKVNWRAMSPKLTDEII